MTNPPITKLGELSVLSFGGGVNSSAILFGIVEKGLKSPDLILFADTGNEWEDTYRHVHRMNEWAQDTIQREIITIHRDNPQYATLEHECWALKTLPSKAFGFGGCSVKWKRQPMDAYIKKWKPAKESFARGESIQRLIGIDAGEQHRGILSPDHHFEFYFPLIEWGWGRAECRAAIYRAGFDPPQKSACFFCPATKKIEVLSLARSRPDLFARAVAIENQSQDLKRVAGLGRDWSWEDLVKSVNPGGFQDVVDDICVDCADGGQRVSRGQHDWRDAFMLL